MYVDELVDIDTSKDYEVHDLPDVCVDRKNMVDVVQEY